MHDSFSSITITSRPHCCEACINAHISQLTDQPISEGGPIKFRKYKRGWLAFPNIYVFLSNSDIEQGGVRELILSLILIGPDILSTCPPAKCGRKSKSAVKFWWTSATFWSMRCICTLATLLKKHFSKFCSKQGNVCKPDKIRVQNFKVEATFIVIITICAEMNQIYRPNEAFLMKHCKWNINCYYFC